MRTLLVSVLSLAVAGVATAALEPGVNDRSLAVDGWTYPYLAYLPAGSDGTTAVPLVVDLHGWTSNGLQQAAISGLRAVADREGFVIVHPSGPGAAWDAGICCLFDADRDDVGFMRALVAAVAHETAIDPARVYVTGLSNGGAMTHRVACDAADLFAAAAPLAFPLPLVPMSQCVPTRPIPLLMTMGLNDVLVRYEGGGFPGAVETFEYWRDVNGCPAGDPGVVETAASGLSWCETYTDCAGGVETGLCSVTAQTFGGTPFDGHVLYLNADFDLAEVVWAFLGRWTAPSAERPMMAAMIGRSVRKARKTPNQKAPLNWTLTLAAGGWSAASDTGSGVSGTWFPIGKKGRKRALAASAPALAAFFGEDLADEAAAPVLTLVLNKRGTRAVVRAAIELADGSTLRVRLRGPVA